MIDNYQLETEAWILFTIINRLYQQQSKHSTSSLSSTREKLYRLRNLACRRFQRRQNKLFNCGAGFALPPAKPVVSQGQEAFL